MMFCCTLPVRISEDYISGGDFCHKIKLALSDWNIWVLVFALVIKFVCALELVYKEGVL
jgi:hypothetical protein